MPTDAPSCSYIILYAPVAIKPPKYHPSASSLHHRFAESLVVGARPLMAVLSESWTFIYVFKFRTVVFASDNRTVSSLMANCFIARVTCVTVTCELTRTPLMGRLCCRLLDVFASIAIDCIVSYTLQ